MNRKKCKSLILQFLKIGFGVAIFTYFVFSGKVNLAKVWDTLFCSLWVPLILSLQLGSITLCTLRWWVLVRSQKIEISFLRTLKLVFIGWFFNVTIPGTISGDVMKVYYIAKGEKNKISAGFSVLMDRFIGLVILVMLTFLFVLLNYSFVQSIPELKAIGWSVGVAFVFFCFFLLFFISRKNAKISSRWPLFLRNLLEAFWAYRGALDKLFIASFMTVLNWLCTVLAYYCAARALGENVLSLSSYFFLIPVGLFVMTIPISPAGVGVGQGIFLTLFSWAYGKTVMVGAEMVTLVQLLIVFWAIIGFFIYITHREKISSDSPSEEGVLVT